VVLRTFYTIIKNIIGLIYLSTIKVKATDSENVTYKIAICGNKLKKLSNSGGMFK